MSTLDSECDFQLDSHINHVDLDTGEYPPEQQPLPLRTTRAGLVVPCTELPAPSCLGDNGDVNVISSHVPKHVVVQSLCGCQQESRSPPSQLTLNHKNSVESHSPLCSSSGSGHRNSAQMPSLASNATSTISSQSASSNHDHSLELFSMSFNSNRDMTIAGNHSPYMSPVEPQPLTMPDIEVCEIMHTVL